MVIQAIGIALLGTCGLSLIIILSLALAARLEARRQRDKAMQRVVEDQLTRQPR